MGFLAIRQPPAPTRWRSACSSRSRRRVGQFQGFPGTTAACRPVVSGDGLGAVEPAAGQASATMAAPGAAARRHGRSDVQNIADVCGRAHAGKAYDARENGNRSGACSCCARARWRRVCGPRSLIEGFQAHQRVASAVCARTATLARRIERLQRRWSATAASCRLRHSGSARFRRRTDRTLVAAG
jgi:hypothetical protein